MNFRAAFFLLLSLWGGMAWGQSVTIVELGEPGEYRFDISGLKILEPLYPNRPDLEPFYVLFFELGDGYYIWDTMPNPVDKVGIQHQIFHTYTRRAPLEDQMQMVVYPLYSKTEKPPIIDIAPFEGGSLTFDPNWANTNQTSGFLLPGQFVRADLSWDVLEAKDEFIVAAGFQNEDTSVLDMGQAVIVSIYYDENLVTPHPSVDNTLTRHYLEDADQISLSGNDPVVAAFETSHDYNLNSRIDFVLPGIDIGVEEFLFAHFTVNGGILPGNSFPMVIAVRNSRSISDAYQAVAVEGAIITGRDPNGIVGYLAGPPRQRPACLADSLDTWEYEISFFNIGNAKVDSFNIKVEFPEFVQLNSYEDIELVFIRLGDDTIDVNSVNPELTGIDNRTMILSFEGVGTLLGLSDPNVDAYAKPKHYCSAEILLRVPRNMGLASCESVDTKLTVVFPGGSQLSRTDTLPCICPPPPSDFPCNIVPDVPFLGGCWCTLLLIVLLAVILLLIIIIAKNAAKPKN